MSSSDQAKTQHTAAGLEDALQRIAGQVGDADRRHRDVLADMQARLGQFDRQVEEVAPAVPEQYAGALGRLEHEIASLTERVAAFGQERQARKERCNTAPSKATPGANNPWDEPWDARSAEALTRIYETTQADSPPSRRPRPASGRQPWPMQAATAQPHAPAPAYDRAWLEGRFANIAAQLQQSLRDNNPAKPLAALDRRLGRLEDRLDSLFKDMSVHFSGAWLELIEEHIKGLAGHFEATRRQLARLDAVDEQLRQLVRAHEEQLPWSRAQPSSLGDDAIAALIDTAAERAASRLAATVPAPVMPTLEAEGSKRIDALDRLMQDYIAERRRGEEATSGMLRHIEAALMRLLDRVDAMEAAGAAAGGPGSGDVPGPNGMDAESKRLAEAYAAGASILGQKPSAPTLDAADYASPIGHREESPQSAAGRPHDAVGADDAQARQHLRVSALRAELKALAVPEGPAADATKADTDKRQHARTWLRPGRSWSNLLLGGAVLALFGIGYLAVDLLTAPGVAPALQQGSPAPATEGQPATGPVRLKAERSGAPEPQSAPRTGKSEIAPPTPDNEGESLPPPAAQPTRRPPRETQNDDVGLAHPPQHPPTVPMRALPGMALQDMPQVANDGAAPLGIDTLASLGVGTAALRTAAAHGDALAQLEVATRFAEGDGVAQDHRLAFAWYERAAMRGLAAAQFRLAAYYERGVGVAVDAERAKIWYRRAAEQGHVRSMHNLAVLIVGSGKDDADYAAAAHWFQQAADRGLSDSQFNLAVLYAHGRGVAKDLTESYKWFGLAARSGDAGAARKLEEVRAQLETLERDAAEQKLGAWRAKPAGR